MNMVEQMFLVRVANLSLEELNFFSMKKSLEMKRECMVLEEQVVQYSKELTDYLYSMIHEVADEAAKKICLNLKRDIHNGRLKKVKKYNVDNLPSQCRTMLDKWILMKNNLIKKSNELDLIFKDEIAEKRKKIKYICSENKLFSEGILIANHDLYIRMQEYLYQEGDLDRKIRNTEISIINYISRMAYKPSPFATFSGVTYGKIGNLNRYSSNYKICRSYRNNISILKNVENNLLKTREAFENSVFTINSTIIRKDRSLIFIDKNIECGDTIDGTERIKTIKINDLIDFILKIFENKNMYTYCELRDYLLSKYNSVNIKELNYVVQQLVSIGLLQNFLVAPNQDYWYLNRLYQSTSNYHDNETNICHIILGYLLEIQEAECLTEKEVKYIYNEMGKLWHVFNHENMPKYNIIFEDAALKNIDLTIDKKIILNNQKAIEDIKSFMTIFDDSILQKIALKLVFDDQNSEYMSFYEFYKIYSQTDKVELWSRIRTSDLYRKIHILRQEIYDYLYVLIQSDDEQVYIDPLWMKNIIRKIPNELLRENKYSMYIQTAQESEKTYIVVNKMGPGLYRHYSRYLNLFSDNGMNEFVEYVEKKIKDIENNENVVLTDINATLGLNINIHPQILGAEITYPRSCPNPGIRQIKLEDIIVHKNYDDQMIGLYEKNNDKRIEILPLGFLFSMLAPKMYSFLSLFSRTNGVEYSFWSKLLIEGRNNKNISFLPRLYYDNIVIDRKTWYVSAKEFKLNDTNEDFFGNIEVVDKKNMDHEVFIKASSVLDSFESEYVTADFEEWLQEVKNTKLRKPQYINFDSYFHQQALKKILNICNHNVIFQEVYPSIDNTFCNKKRVMEFLIE